MKIKKLTKYLQMEEEKLLNLLHKELVKLDYTVMTNEKEEYLYAIPKAKAIPVMLVAHVDTVHRKPPEDVFFDSNQRVMWSPDGLGADDRAGVFAAMEIVRKYPVAVLFTTGEESGGKGAKAFTKDIPSNPSDYRMLIQLDRRNANDAVFYSNEATDFHDYVVEFGFKKAYGSFSDISVIGPAWQINSVNLSIGYVNEHRPVEHLYIDCMLNTINKVCELLKCDIPLFDYKEKTYAVTRWANTRVWDKDKKTWVVKDGRDTNELDDYDEYNWWYGRNVVNMENRRSSASRAGQHTCSECNVYVMFAEEVWIDEELYCKECVEIAKALQEEGIQDDIFDCVFCSVRTTEDNEVWLDGEDLCCAECFNGMDGFVCENCNIETLPAMLEHDQAADLKICDECFVTFFEDIALEEIDVDKKAKVQ